MRVIVAGTRNFENYEYLRQALDHLLKNQLPHVTIISGGARGADRLGEKYAQERELPVEVYPADWNKHGKSAGYRRNVHMVRNIKADGLVAFWDGQSRGTQHVIKEATQWGLAVRVLKI